METGRSKNASEEWTMETTAELLKSRNIGGIFIAELVQLAFHTSAAFDLLHPSVADPEDRARGTTEVLGAVPPVGLQGANPPHPRNWSKCILCNGKSIFMNTKM